MSSQNPYQTLGVTENASFDEIQEAKQRLSQQYREDTKALESIEAAYDAIIMERLRMRQEGKIKVPDRIRFAERSEPPFKINPNAVSQSPNWLQQFIERPSQKALLWPTGIFLILGGLTIFVQNRQDSLLSLLIALGFFANLYFLNRKEGRWWRSVLMSLIGLFLGLGLGSVLASLLELPNSGIPLNVEQLSSLTTFILFWIMSGFLR
jgi:uncharacterized membrane protein